MKISIKLFHFMLAFSVSNLLSAQCTAPTPSVTASGPTAFCKGGSVDLSVSGNNALQFDGIDDQVDCGNDVSVQITGTQITLEAWIYPTSWQPMVWQGNIINKEQDAIGDDQGYMLRAGAAGQLNFSLGNDFWHELTSPPGALILNTWQHVAGIYDGATMKIYVNGIMVGSSPVVLSIGNATSDLTIGNWALGVGVVGRYFPGRIDEVRVWNTTRTAAEITADMFHTIPGDSPGLVAYYTFNEGIDMIANDNSINNNDGNLIGGALWEVPSASPVEAPEYASYLWSPGGQTTATINVTKSYNYSVVVTDALGCTATSAPFNVTAYKVPPAHITPGGPIEFCAGESVVLTANTGAGISYQWYMNAELIIGATAIDYTATTAGIYKCNVTKDATGCNRNSNAIEVSITCREDALIEKAKTFSIYPNPANDFIAIETINNNVKTIYISDALGQIVQTIYSSENVININLNNISSGIYFIKMDDGVNSVTQKFMKQ